MAEAGEAARAHLDATLPGAAPRRRLDVPRRALRRRRHGARARDDQRLRRPTRPGRAGRRWAIHGLASAAPGDGRLPRRGRARGALVPRPLSDGLAAVGLRRAAGRPARRIRRRDRRVGAARARLGRTRRAACSARSRCRSNRGDGDGVLLHCSLPRRAATVSTARPSGATSSCSRRAETRSGVDAAPDVDLDPLERRSRGVRRRPEAPAAAAAGGGRGAERRLARGSISIGSSPGPAETAADRDQRSRGSARSRPASAGPRCRPGT